MYSRVAVPFPSPSCNPRHPKAVPLAYASQVCPYIRRTSTRRSAHRSLALRLVLAYSKPTLTLSGPSQQHSRSYEKVGVSAGPSIFERDF